MSNIRYNSHETIIQTITRIMVSCNNCVTKNFDLSQSDTKKYVDTKKILPLFKKNANF